MSFRRSLPDPAPSAPVVDPPMLVPTGELEAFAFAPPPPPRTGALDGLLRALAAAREGAPEAAEDGPAWIALATTDPATSAPAAIAAFARTGPAPAAEAAEALAALSLTQVARRAAVHDAGDFTGAGKTVVVIDTGFSHRYDQSAVAFSYDFSGRNDRDASVQSLYSHGSWVGQVVSRTAPDVEVIHLKVFDDAGRSASFLDIEQALRWTVANAARFDVAAVNLSLGLGSATREARTLLSDEFARLDAMGVTTTVAAGNGYARYKSGVNVLAADPSVVAVSATTAADAFAGFSQRHAALTDIAALGHRVTVETVDGLVGRVSGTSFAAPYVAGAAAVLQEAAETVVGRSLDPDEIVGILRASGEAVTRAPVAAGYRVADVDAAVDWFLDNAGRYADTLA